jgi:hypothetical protein
VIASAILRRRHTHDLGEPRTERSQRRTAHGHARIRDRHPLTEERFCALNATRHEIRIGGLAICLSKLAREVRGRHKCGLRHRRHVEGSRVLAVHEVTSSTKVHEICHVLRGHDDDDIGPVTFWNGGRAGDYRYRWSIGRRSGLEIARSGGHVYRVFSKRVQRNNLKGTHVRRRQDHVRGGPVSMRAQPVDRRHAPPITRHQSGEPVLWHRRRQIVADRSLVLEKFAGDDSADGVTARVFGARCAAAITIEACDRIRATRLQLTTKDVTVGHGTSMAGARRFDRGSPCYRVGVTWPIRASRPWGGVRTPLSVMTSVALITKRSVSSGPIERHRSVGRPINLIARRFNG